MNRRSVLAGAATVLALATTVESTRPAHGTTPPAPAPKASPTIFSFGAVGDGVTDDSAAFSAALTAAAANGVTVQVPCATYAIKKPITWTSTADVGVTWGLECQGATLISGITSGADVISLTSTHTVRYFKLTGGLSIVGSGSDGNGLHIAALSSSVYFYNALIDALSIEKTGEHGLLIEGNVFESTISNSYFQDAGKSGAVFAQSQGGVVSAINVLCSYFNQNGQYGLWCTNFDATYGGTTDVRVYGGYCRQNASFGFYYNNGTAGSTCIEQVGFENNCTSLKPGDATGAHIYALSSLLLRNVGGFNEFGGATYLVRGYFTGLANLEGCTQAAGGAMATTGLSRLVQVNGTQAGFVLMRACNGGVDAVENTPCGWQAQNCTGPSPRGTLSAATTV